MGQKGIVIVLDQGVKVPEWITKHEKYVGVSTRISKGRELPVLTVFNGAAGFIAGGQVDINFPGSKGFRVAFEPRKVLEIVDLATGGREKNRYLCENCYALTGEKIQDKPIYGTIRQETVFGCRGCDAKWSIET